MNFCIPLNRFKQRASALAFIIFPLIYVFAFATHPGLFTPHLLTVQELISRAHQNSLLQFGHMLVTFNNFLVIVCAIHFMKVLEKSAGWHGTIGGLLAILGAVLLAADKGAMCLTMSALDNISETQFAQMLPGLVAIFSKQGWLVILWGFILLPVGFAIQTIGLLKSRSLPKWQSILFLVGVLLVGTPDGMEIINLSASILMAASLIPYGIKLIRRIEAK